MKFITLLSSVLLSPIVSGSPLQVDVNVHIDTPGVVTHAVKKSPACGFATSTSSSKLPLATLGYEIHQASPLKEGQTYYAFENIPYAKQPVGDLRFKAAQVLTPYDDVDDPPLNDGSKTVVCPQEQVGWYGFAGEWATQLFNTEADLDQKFGNPIGPEKYPSLPKSIANQSEECLMLDVFVPKRVYDNEDVDVVPVIVSFHGGGFIFGSKTIFGSPAGILKAAGENGVEGDVIVVSVNYRLGAFGWLAGEDFTNGGGFENAGLSDQKAALEWVSNTIQIFGGNPYAVTVLGESAGASSILHHLTAYGIDRSYKQPPKFQRAILQSPAFFPQVSPRQVNNTYHAFLEAAGVKSFAELQSAKSDVLIKANSKTTYYSPYGTFTYGPVVSEKRDPQTYVQFPPSLKLMTGAWFRDIQVMIASNRREGALFTPPWLRNEGDLAQYIKGIYPAMSNESFETFAKLYPVPQTKKNLKGDTIPTTERERFIYAAAAFGDLGVDCTAWLFKEKSSSDNYRYFYRIYPGFHGQDVGATWYPEAGKELTSPLFNPQSQSERLQRWLTCFAKDQQANPNCAKKDGDKDFQPMSEGAMWIGFGLPIIKDKEQVPDETYAMSKLTGDLPSDEVCDFWSYAPYWENDPEVARALTMQKALVAEL